VYIVLSQESKMMLKKQPIGDEIDEESIRARTLDVRYVWRSGSCNWLESRWAVLMTE
jgi:hypothetical protein